MRLMLFYDLENLRQGLCLLDKTRFPEFGRLQYYLIERLAATILPSCDAESLVRAYAYTGEYTPAILKKIEADAGQEADPAAKARKEKALAVAARKYSGQQKEFSVAKYWDFFELRKVPLQYANGRVFQKGVDVQLAVDLVSHAFRGSFDAAVVCSGDIDLLESVRTVKSLGKKVVVASHPECASRELIRESDHFLDFAKFPKEEYDRFSHVFVPKA